MKRPFVVFCSMAVTALPMTFLLLVTGPVSSGASCDVHQLFTPAADHGAGINPHDIVLGDFNGDGNLDFAVANAGSDVVSVNRGFGDGTFSSPTLFSTGDGPEGLTTGDFNGDGITDLAVANGNSGSVSILLGLGSGGVGNGTFGPPADFPAGAGAYRIAVGDFNHDGISDLAVANNGAGNVSVLLGHGSAGLGDGTFASPIDYSTGTYPIGVVTHDFNGDGILDLAVCNYGSSSLNILLGQGTAGVGDGTFILTSSYPTGASPFHVAASDLNSDGIVDLVTGNHLNVSVFLGHGSGGIGDGTFAGAVNYSSGPAGGVIAFLDADRDGITDKAVTNSSDEVHILQGHSTAGVANGTFSDVASYPLGQYSISLAAGDLNGDSRSDLVAPNYEGASVSVLLARCVDPAPSLTDVRDVPNDQGGFVFLTWLASALDNPQDHSITGYRVWRRIPPAAAQAAVTSAGRSTPDGVSYTAKESRVGDVVEVTYWEALTTLPAEFLEGYGYTAPTTQDSMKNSNPYTAFFVTALTSNPAVFYESNIDSGYSVDNLRPRPPRQTVAAYDGAAVALHWNPSTDPDLAEYRVYRGETSDFVPAPDNLIGSPDDTSLVDVSGQPGEWYKVSSVDTHGNESDFDTATAPAVLAAEGPRVRFALEGIIASSGRLVVRFSLPTAAPARLELVDVAGRLLASHMVGTLGAGTHELNISDGERFASGLYFVRLRQAAQSASSKIVITN